MMKPKFDDILEYVRMGEVDPEMSQLLDLDPDGQDLLKLARFICKALRDRYSDSGSDRNVANWPDIAEALHKLDMAAASEEMFSPADRDSSVFKRGPGLPKFRRKQPFSLRRILARIESDRQDLGTLKFTVGETQIAVSYRPSAVVASYTKEFGKKISYFQPDLPGIQIQSRDINISLPDTIAVGRQVTLQLTRRFGRVPARHLDLVFMPYTSPFVRLRSDDQGCVDLPEPIRSGILRIESGKAQFLHIQVEEP